MTPRPVVIGAGVNGLAAAFYLAKAGLRPLVLERAERVGGAASTRELAPGVRMPDLTHAVGPIRQDIAEAMGLASRGVQWLRPAVDSFTPAADGRALVLPRDLSAAAAAIGQFSARDATRYPEFLREIGAIGAVVSALLAEVPVSIDQPTTGELWRLLQIGRRFRGLGREQVFRALRWGPMPVADLLADVFETELLRATLSLRGVFASALGPRSAGTAAALILEAARQPSAPFAPVFVQGGPGQLASAMAAAATEAGAEIRCGAAVTRIDVDDSGVSGVTLANGDRIEATTVVSNADPQRTLLGLVDPVRLEPDVILRIRNYRARGTLAKVNLVMKGLPSFAGLKSLPGGLTPDTALSGRILIGPTVDEVERAYDASKYGEWSPRPWLECVIPTLTDSTLAPSGTHVLSIYAQYAPYRLRSGSWAEARAGLQQAVIDRLAEFAPDVPSRIVEVETITPADLESTYGLTGGHIHHGEMALDQLFIMRPTLGWAQHATPIDGLYLCGAGTHPGGGITGANGAHAAKTVIAAVKGSKHRRAEGSASA
jgi:phytoene dehydrogenase-like protein